MAVCHGGSELYGILRNIVLLNKSVKIIDHGLQRNAFHGFLDCVLDFSVRYLQYLTDVLGHWAASPLTGMNPNDGGHTLRLQCRIDLVQGNLGWVGAQLRTAGSTGHRNKPRLFNALRMLRMTTGLLPVLWARRLLVTLAIPFAS